MNRRYRLSARPRLEILESRQVLSAVTPAQLTSAYGLNAISFAKGTIKGNGAGQTIAIVDAYNDPTIASDLHAFDVKYGLPDLATVTPLVAGFTPNGQTSQTSQASPGYFTALNFGGTAPNSSWNYEEALDVETAHAAAPGANIILLEAKTGNLGDLLNAINAARSIQGVSVVSMSFGGPEFNGQQQLDNYFTTPVGHVGITFLASSGDEGAGAEWPASSANVVGVGGTSLTVSTTGTRASESAWSGSGGAISQYVTKPSYQASVLSGTHRGAPDVSLDADPNTGVVIVSGGGQVQIGGTSLAAPVWAGLIAIADQGLVVAGKAPLDGATKTLPALYKAPAGSFNDITTGSRATVGYDTSTGLGSPNAATLVPYLAGSPTSTIITITLGGSTPTRVIPTTILGSATASPSPTVAGSSPVVPVAQGGVADWSSFVPNLVEVQARNIFTKPEATDAALETWGLD